MNIDLPLMLGILGALCVLVGFLLVQRHIWTQDSLSYDLLNCTGSIFLVIYGWAGGAWPFVVLNGIWALYSLKDIISDVHHTPKQLRKNS